MIKDGYIKIYRSSTDNKLYLSEPFTKWQAWCDLIFLAYFADSTTYVRGVRVETKRGCVYRGSEELATRWKWSRGKVLRFLSYLEGEGQVVQQKSNVINCISIVNYDKYQSNDTTCNTESEKKEAKKRREENLTPYNPPNDSKRFIKPTVDEVRAYCQEKGFGIDAEYFINYYEANGWVQGRDRKPIKNWKACIATWVRKDKRYGADRQSGQQSTDHPSNEQLLQQTRELINAADEREKQGYNSQILPF